MRDFTISLLRFPWAISMMGLNQALNAFDGNEGMDKTRDSFNAVSGSAEGQMRTRVKDLYRAGDELQTGMVKAWMDNWSDPAQALQDTWDTVDRSWHSLRDALSREADKAKGKKQEKAN